MIFLPEITNIWLYFLGLFKYAVGIHFFETQCSL